MSLNLYNKYFVSDKNPQNNISSILSIYEMPDMEDKNENITLVLENLLDKGNESYLSFVDSEYEHKKTRTRSLISKNSNKLDI
jgi:hypothetical protein